MNHLRNKPKGVKIAIILSCVAIVLSSLSPILPTVFGTTVGVMYWFINRIFPSLVYIYAGLILMKLIFTLICIYFVSKGQNWARIALVVLLAIDIIFFLTDIGYFFLFPIMGLVDLLVIMMQIIAIVFLYKENSDLWFNSIRYNAAAA